MAYMNTGRETGPESREDRLIELRAGEAIWTRVARGVSPVVATAVGRPSRSPRSGHSRPADSGIVA